MVPQERRDLQAAEALSHPEHPLLGCDDAMWPLSPVSVRLLQPLTHDRGGKDLEGQRKQSLVGVRLSGPG